MTAAQLLAKSSDIGTAKIAEKIANQALRLGSMFKEQLGNQASGHTEPGKAGGVQTPLISRNP